jgi:DNA-binding response OmpR family regulator
MELKPVLLVEMERAYADLVKLAFEQVSIRNPMDVVSSEREAVRYLTFLMSRPGRNSPALILLALLPQLCNQSRMVRWIRQQPPLLGVPCVVFSGDDPAGGSRSPRELICDYYVQKPRDFSELLALAARLRERWLLENAA